MAYIKTLKDNELIGGQDNTDVYPITSTQAVYSQKENGSAPEGKKVLLEERLTEIENRIDTPVGTDDIVDGAVVTRKIADNAITTSKIDNGAVTSEKIASNAITNDKIANGTIIGDKFTDDSIDGSKIKDNSVPGSKLADGAIESIDLQDNTLSGSKLADNSVDGDKLVDGAVTSAKLKDNSIDGSKIADSTIQSLDIKDGTISGAKLANNTITGDKLADGIIDNSKIANNTITGDKFLDESISGEKIQPNTIHGSKLETGTVDGADIIDGTLHGSKIADMSVDGDKLADDSIETRHIKSNTISGSKIVANSIDGTKIRNNSLIGENFADEVITNAKIADDAVTNSKIANNTITSGKIVDGAITTIKLANGSVGGTSIADNAITNAKLQDDSIVNRNIATGTLTGDKFVDNTITGDKILDNTIPGSKIKDGTIENVDIKDNTLSGAKLVNNSISGSKIADNAITSAHLLDNSIPASKILDGTIESIDIKDGTLDGSKIKDNTITGAKLADNAVTSDKIPNSSITTDKIANLAVAEGKIGSSAVTNTKIANDAVTTDKINNGAITTDKILDNNITTVKIADEAITTAKIANNSVTTDKIADLNVTTAKIADGAVTEAKLADGAITPEKIADSTITELQTIMDNVPTSGSSKPVMSGGVYEALAGKQDTITDLGAIRSGVAKVGYYECDSLGNSAAKTISADNYVLSTGGSMKVKMVNANTANNATLNINNTGAKPLYYAGERASANNSWEAGETVEVYYDGTNFYANNVAGGSKFSTGENLDEVGIDNIPTEGSQNLVRSGGVYNLAAGFQETLEDISEDNITRVNQMMEDYQPIVIEGNVENAPDEEDLTSVNVGGTDVIRFKDKTYNAELYSGLGRVYLRKNMVNGVNTLTQSIINDANTIYVIRYDYDLAGATITIPENCVLKFEGGCLSDGTLYFNSTKIVSDSKCFSTDITFGTSGHIINDEVPISWFINKTDVMVREEANRDCHDEIRLASLLAGRINSGMAVRRGGTLNLEHIQLSVMQPIILDSLWDCNLIKNANISFYSTADGQSIIHYNSNDINYCALENCQFTYYGSVETKDSSTVANRLYHENINAVRFEKCSPTSFCYWRDIKTSMLTGYVFVNQVYLQEVTFENISSNGCNGMISYNVDGYYNGNKGSSNIVSFNNCNLNGGNQTSSYYSKCITGFLWDFRGFMELEINNAVSQGVGKNGQKAIRLGPGVVYPQSVTLNGFWLEHVKAPVDNRVYIDSSTDLYLNKRNVYGFVTGGNGEIINIYYRGQGSNYFQQDRNFIDRSEIVDGTGKVAIYFEPTTYSNFITFSDKFIEWFDKGIIRCIDTRQYPYGSDMSTQNTISMRVTQQYDLLKKTICNMLTNNTFEGTSYVSGYKGIITATIERLGSESTYNASSIIGSTSGCYVEIVYRCAPLIDVNDENIDSVSIKGLNTSFYLYKPEIGDTAGTFTSWKRIARVSNAPGSFKLANAKMEIAYCMVFGSFGLRDYKSFYYDYKNEDLIPKADCENTTELVFNTRNGLTESTLNNINSVVRINNVLIRFVSNYGGINRVYYKSSEGLTPLTNLSGSSQKRPKALAAGCSYFDTTLGKPIYVKTVDSTTGDITWVDATGTVV